MILAHEQNVWFIETVRLLQGRLVTLSCTRDLSVKMYNECFPHISKTLQKDMFFSQSSNGAGKNEFISQYTCLKTHFSEMMKQNK